MDDKTIIRLSLVFSILGIIILSFFVGKIEENDYIDFTILENNDVAKISGEILDIRLRDSVSFIEIEAKGIINIVAFEKIEIKESEYNEIIGRNLEVIGKINIDEKHGKSIIADRIKIIN